MTTRTTREIVLIILVIGVVAVVVIAVIGLVLIRLFVPSTDVADAVHALSQIVQLLLGVTVGYLAGRVGTRPDSERG